MSFHFFAQLNLGGKPWRIGKNRPKGFGGRYRGLAPARGPDSGRGIWVGRGTARFKSDVRTVTVKGLVEKEVPADEAVWTLSLRRASDDLKDAHAKISGDRDAVLAFLQKQGFKDSEIVCQPTRTIDKLAREYGQQQGTERFNIRCNQRRYCAHA